MERCYECHSAEAKVKGGLRLDSREGWEKGGDTGAAIVPGTPDKSLLLEAVRYENRDLQMPPKQKLSASEISLLEEWVRIGAPDPRRDAKVLQKKAGMSVEEGRRFWCYAPVKRVAPPKVRDEEWPRGNIDRFTLAAMEGASVRPAGDAPVPALARRTYLSLSGLPPSPGQIASFVSAASRGRESAMAALVDELLESPRFGEAWGRHWLDVARFAESSGGGRTLLFKDAWRYRDYVIEAFNSGTPFDQFIREQIAGDLLPAKSVEERRRNIVATAFLALGPTNYEEQDKQQLRYDVIDEQIETMGRAFLGQTIGCARCHDHKFDPVPQKDYYALAGIFASTRTLFNYTDNVARWISSALPADGALEQQLVEHERHVGAMRKQLDGLRSQLTRASKVKAAGAAASNGGLSVASLPGIVLDDADARIVGDWKHSRNIRPFIGSGYLTDDNDGKGQKTLTFTPAISKAGRYDVRLAYTHGEGRAKNAKVTVFHADGEDVVFVDESEAPPIEGQFISLGKFRFEKDGAGYVLISNEGTSGFVTVDALQLLSEEDLASSGSTSAGGSEDSRSVEALRNRVKEMEAAIAASIKSGPVRETAMVVEDDSTIANARIRIRGVEKQRGEEVERGFLQVAMQTEGTRLPASSSGRRELADWIVSEQNPLTARVLVNRVWGWLFGTGIVPSVDNFGTTGDAPSNPELLDYLACRFVDEGWSVKKLVREIVLSRTWQLAVEGGSGADPENRLFARANRRRLNAEQIRDSLLAVSGKLDLRLGGQNIDGAGDIDANNSSAQNIEYGYVFKDTRRSVYTPAFRNKRLEIFELFDFGNINQTMGQRTAANVSPQGLFFLNSPFVLEQSRAAANRALTAAPDTSSRLRWAFDSVLGRAPSEKEAAICMRLFGGASEADVEAWAKLFQMLFASMDFRYME